MLADYLWNGKKFLIEKSVDLVLSYYKLLPKITRSLLE